MPKPQSYSSEMGLRVTTWNATQAKAAADAWLASKLATVTARQETYRTANGRYWQGLATHAAPVAHTANKDDGRTGDRLNASPTDQAATWLAIFPEWSADRFPAVARIDAYDGPLGKGWTLTIELRHNGDRWRRVENVGPETWRAMAWVKLVLT